MALPDVSVPISGGGLGRKNLSLDMVTGLCLGGVAVGGGAQLNQSYQLKSLADAEGIGLDAAYDDTNTVLIHYHIKEYFRLNLNGELWIRLVAQGTSQTDMWDKANTHVKQLLVDAGGRIRRCGTVLNPSAGYTPTTTDGIDADVLTAIPKAKALLDEEASLHRNLGGAHIEGWAFTGTATNAEDLRALTGPGVSVVILQDYDVADADALLNNTAAVGTELGLRSKLKVNEDIMWVEKGNIQDTANSKFLNVALSSHLKIETYSETDQGTLHDKGYIFGRTYVGVDGVYFNGGNCAVELASDFAYQPENEVVAKAARLIYAALIPKLGNPVVVDSTTGKLDSAFVSYLERLGYSALATMESALEISGKDVYVDPAQDVLSTSKLVVKFSITPTGTAREIEAPLSFTNPF